jgi:S-adenosylmethionine synthetase
MGEVRTQAYVDVDMIVRDVVRDIGYTGSHMGFDAESCAVANYMHSQSADIAMGVDESYEVQQGMVKGDDAYDRIGAGDQGLMFGYACDETAEKMPLAISLSHALCKQLTKVRKDGTLAYLQPDGKAQVTVEYENDEPVRIETVVVSSQHTSDVSLDTIRADIEKHVIRPVIPAELLDKSTNIFINPTGRFVVGGPQGDTGLTGRKIIVDTYGGYARHGGGAFSGKDPTKVDRSACYMARYAAKNIVAAGLAKKCEIQLAYAIGVANPVSIFVDTFGTGSVADDKIAEAVCKVFDFRPAAIIDTLQLRRPIYRPLAAYGHIGREDLDVVWERTDKVDALRAALA